MSLLLFLLFVVVFLLLFFFCFFFCFLLLFFVVAVVVVLLLFLLLFLFCVLLFCCCCFYCYYYYYYFHFLCISMHLDCSIYEYTCTRIQKSNSHLSFSIPKLNPTEHRTFCCFEQSYLIILPELPNHFSIFCRAFLMLSMLEN